MVGDAFKRCLDDKALLVGQEEHSNYEMYWLDNMEEAGLAVGDIIRCVRKVMPAVVSAVRAYRAPRTS